MRPVVILLVGWFALLCAAAPRQTEPQPVRFMAVDVLVDSGDEPLAAYQLDLRVVGRARIVGIEGGASAAFAEPPYYDPAAIQQDRVIIAAFSTVDPALLPTGRTRIATIHLQVDGDEDPTFDAAVTATATADGSPIHADPILQVGDDS